LIERIDRDMGRQDKYEMPNRDKYLALNIQIKAAISPSIIKIIFVADMVLRTIRQNYDQTGADLAVGTNTVLCGQNLLGEEILLPGSRCHGHKPCRGDKHRLAWTKPTG